MPAAFEFARGSIIGTSHLWRGINNQDAHHLIFSPDKIIAVVADGCGSGKFSEVGAQLGARMVVELLNRRLTEDSIRHKSYLDDQFWHDLQKEILDQIEVIIRGMSSDLVNAIADFFLFTIVGFLITAEETIIFALGDGIYYLNGFERILGPFPRNAPPYLAYNLVNHCKIQFDQRLLNLRIIDRISTASLQSILIGTDGVIDLKSLSNQNVPGNQELVGAIDQLWTDDRYFNNSDSLRRKLAQINPVIPKNRFIKDAGGQIEGLKVEKGLLQDDTTLIVLRRMGSWSDKS